MVAIYRSDALPERSMRMWDTEKIACNAPQDHRDKPDEYNAVVVNEAAFHLDQLRHDPLQAEQRKRDHKCCVVIESFRDPPVQQIVQCALRPTTRA